MIREDKVQTVLVTGAAGMIGSAAVKGLLAAGYRLVGIDRKEYPENLAQYRHYVADLADKDTLEKLIAENAVDRVVHLAALAHASDGKEYTWEDYRYLNVDCAKNIFEAAGALPVLFISTVDVYGFAKGAVNAQTETRPVSHYAKSKVMAENECKKLPHYTIFRFSPVYTDTVKRDIQKRYYLKYPGIAYQVGKGAHYEVLNIRNAVAAMVDWCGQIPQNDIKIIKDPQPMSTVDCIKAEKQEGRAKLVLKFPRWMIKAGFAVLKGITGENKYTYLLSKVVCPLRTE